MHTQTDTATAIIDAHGDYVFTVKANQPSLYAACKRLPWRDVGERSSLDRRHGRRVRRTIKVVTAPVSFTFTAAAQVTQIRRTTTRAGKKTVEVVHVITSPDHRAAPPPVLATWIQGHWGIENRAHSSSTTRTAPASAPATPPRSWPPSATPRSACFACPHAARPERPITLLLTS